SFSNAVPHLSYKYQLSTYMIYIGIPDGKLYYQNRDNSKQLEFDLHITDPVVKDTKDLINFYNYNFYNNIVPDVTNIKTKCSATTCKYFNKCSEYSVLAQKDI